MLYTNFKHLETATNFRQTILENENVLIICGRMDPTSISVYRIVEELEPEYNQVKFFDMEYDNPESFVIRHIPEVNDALRPPFAAFFRNGEMVMITDRIQSKKQISELLNTSIENKKSN